MKVAIVGLGRLGLPVALAIEAKGHAVVGCDVSERVREIVTSRQFPHREESAQEMLSTSDIKLLPLFDAVEFSDIVFVAVQTPHEPQYEGIMPLPRTRKDFDYTHLKDAVRDVCEIAQRIKKSTALVVVSTCLPGTFERDIKPLLNHYVQYAYSPLYIAMGTVIDDYLNPEFALIGVEDAQAADILAGFYSTIHDAPHVRTDVTTAEGIKVFYNSFITAKILLANAWMQVAHKVGMNIDHITAALALATKRILSPAYMSGGGPDAGGCHPRDLIALSWLGKKIDLKPNLFEIMAKARDSQTEWTVDLVARAHFDTRLPVYVLGKAFKPGTNITTGSGATLFVNMLAARGIDAVQYDPHIDDHAPDMGAGIYFVATKHEAFKYFEFPTGSIVCDLWRYIPEREGVTIVRIGNP